ncbi:MAG: hypothetical protein M1839_003739 [Geoglossum umbratile]|nr:MAG: hypothetical protein M1839_003739 [Geoglossum umbratile]
MDTDICATCRSVFETTLSQSIFKSRKRVYAGSLLALRSSCPICQVLREFLQTNQNPNKGSSTFKVYFRDGARLAYLSPPDRYVGRLYLTSPKSPYTSAYCLEMAVDHASPLANLIPGRPRHCDVKSDSTLNVIRGWMQECASSHPHCRAQSVLKPRRLLSISDSRVFPDIRLRLSSTQPVDQKYAALSYCWGPPAIQKHQVTTTKANLKDHERVIRLSELPQTIVDAVSVGRQLDIPYLWVDALCIVQDDKDDQDNQIAIMGSIYANAYLTVSASSASNCVEGFLHRRKNPYFSMNYSYQGREPCLVNFVELGRACESWKEPVHERGWTFQETLLSRRILFYSSVQPYWWCRTSSLSGGDPPPELYFTKTNLRELLDVSRNNNVNKAPAVHYRWLWLATQYSKRVLGDLNHKVKALHALSMSHKQARGGNVRYLAGLWNTTMHIDLIWYTAQRGKHRRVGPKPNHSKMKESGEMQCTSNRILSFPTWSWMSFDGKIDYPCLSGTSMKLLLDQGQTSTGARGIGIDDENVLEVDVKSKIDIIGEPLTNRFGEVNPGSLLIVQGRVKKVLIPEWTTRKSDMVWGPLDRASNCLDLHLDKKLPPQVRVCYKPEVWNSRKGKYRESSRQSLGEYKLGTITFDEYLQLYAMEDAAEDLAFKGREYECLHVVSLRPLDTKQVWREGPTMNGVFTKYKEPVGMKAYGLVLGRVERGGENRRVRLGLFESTDTQESFFNDGKLERFELE